MASGPFKIRLKINKPEDVKEDRNTPEAKSKGKKRPRLEEPEAGRAERNHHIPSEGALGASQGGPRREGGSAYTSAPANHQSLQPQLASQAPAKPRLVIKGSFGSKKQHSQQTSSLVGGPTDGVPPAKRHKQEKRHKEKKRKKHKDRPPESSGLGVPHGQDGRKLPDAHLLPILPSKGGQLAAKPAANPVAVHDKNEVGALPSGKTEATSASTVLPTTEPPPTASVKTASHAVSGVTGISADAATQAVSSKANDLLGGSGQEASSKADHPPVPGDIEKLLSRLQKRDAQHFFRDPVTDAVAPGYTEIIKRPMSFSQMLARLANGDYASWKPVQEDLETIFNNAMVFNGPKSPYHQKARELMGVARKMLHTVRTTGQFDARGRKPASANRPPGLPLTGLTGLLSERRTERRVAAKPEKPLKPKVDKRKIAARKAAQRAAASGVLAKPGAEDYARGDSGAFGGEYGARAQFPQLQGQAVEAQWGALAAGASAEGVEFRKGRPTLRANFTGMLSLERYTASLRAFGAKLTGTAKELLEKKIAAAAKMPEPKPLPAATSSLPAPAQQSWTMPGTSSSPQVPWHFLAQPRPTGAPATSQPPTQVKQSAAGLAPYLAQSLQYTQTLPVTIAAAPSGAGSQQGAPSQQPSARSAAPPDQGTASGLSQGSTPQARPAAVAAPSQSSAVPGWGQQAPITKP